MVSEAPRRYRKRGGAKKKKKQQQQEQEQQNDSYNIKPQEQKEDEQQQQYSEEKNYKSGFSSFSNDLQSFPDQDFIPYLEKVAQDLEQLDPGAQLATQWLNQNNQNNQDDQDDIPQSILLARNVLKQLAPRAHQLCKNGYAARFMEQLLQLCSDISTSCDLLKSILACGSKQFIQLCIHSCASHFLQKSIHIISKYIQNDINHDDINQTLQFLAQIIQEWTNDDIIQIIYSPSGSHVFRECVTILAGIPIDEPRQSKIDDTNPKYIYTYIDTMKIQVCENYHQILQQVSKTLLQTNSNQLLNIPWNPSSSTAIQALLSSISVSDKTLTKQLFDCIIQNQFEQLIYDSCGSRFIERGLLCLGNLFQSQFFKGNLIKYSRHPKANFCVQRYLLGLKGRGAVMNVWDELEDEIKEMIGFGKGREGVILSLLRITETQGDENCRKRASRNIISACGAKGDKTKDLIGILIMGNDEIWSNWKYQVNQFGRSGLGLNGKDNDNLFIPYQLIRPTLLGTLIARCLIRFPGGPGQACRDSMNNLTSNEILALLGNPIGSRLIEQWIESDNSKQGTKIATKLLSILIQDNNSSGLLACCRNQYSVMVLVKCITRLQSQYRKSIMDILATHYHTLKKHDYAQIVIRKCRVEQYMRKGNEWDKEESTRETKNRLFADILNDDDDDYEEKQKNEKHKRKVKKRKRTNKLLSTEVNLLPKKSKQKVKRNTNDDIDNDNEDNGNITTVLGAIEKVAEKDLVE